MILSLGEGVDVDPFEHSPLNTENDDGASVRSPQPQPPQRWMDGPRLVSPASRLGEVVPPLRFHPEGKSRPAMPAAVRAPPPLMTVILIGLSLVALDGLNMAIKGGDFRLCRDV